MSNRNDLPPATAGNFLARVREELTIMMGNRGTPLDQAVRFKDLQDSSLLRLDSGFLAGRAGNRPAIAGPGPAVPSAYVTDLTPPPTPTGFAASAAISNLFVQHDAPLFLMGHGYLRTVLYGASRLSTTAPVPTFANAVQLTQFIGPFAAYPTNPSTIWHLWIKWMTVDGVLSVSPAGGINGLQVKTGVDVKLLIDALTGQITASQLYSDLGARINLIDTPGTGLVTRLSNEILTRGSTDSAINTRIDNVVSVATIDRGVAGAAVNSEANARVSADGALATRVDTVQSIATTDRGAAAAAVSSEATARTSADGALSSRVDTVQSTATTDRGTAASAITSEQTARSNADGALGTRIDTVQATAINDRGTFTTAISTEQTARASADGTLFAQYSVKVDTNGYVSGFGLSSTVNNAAPTSAFAVRADKFYIASPSGPGITPTVPFIVRTSPTTINGVDVPAGTYIQDAFIANGTITNVKIGNAAIDDAKVANLSASKLTAGSISVGAFISSSNYVSGSQGWRINGSGSAEFSGVVVRGTVYASAGVFSGDISGANGNFRGQITGGAFTGYAFPPGGSGGGFYLGSSGLLLGSVNDGKYFQVTSGGDVYSPQFSIVNGNATFAGNLNAAGGTFSGALSANSVQVNTLNIAGNAVTVPMVDTVAPNFPGTYGNYNHTIYVYMSQPGKLFATGTIVQGYSSGPVPAWQLVLSINNTQVYNTGTVNSAFQQSATASGGLVVPAGQIAVTLSWAGSVPELVLGLSSLYAVGAMR